MQALAAGAGLAPPIVLADPGRGFIVSRHVAGRAADARRLCGTRRCSARRRLDRAPARPGAAAGTRGRRLRRARGRLSRARHRRQRRTDVRRSRASSTRGARRCRRLRGSRPAITTCITATSSTTACGSLAVDWEYAGPGDPAADLASCIGYHELDDAAVDALLAGYGSARRRCARASRRSPGSSTACGTAGTRPRHSRASRRTPRAGATRALLPSGCTVAHSRKMRDPWPRSPSPTATAACIA